EGGEGLTPPPTPLPEAGRGSKKRRSVGQGSRLLWLLYAALVGYTAVNVPLACQLATPLTWPMLRAARGTLGDSVWHHLTLANSLRLLAVLAGGVALPLLLGRLRWRPSRRLGVALPARAAPR